MYEPWKYLPVLRVLHTVGDYPYKSIVKPSHELVLGIEIKILSKIRLID